MGTRKGGSAQEPGDNKRKPFDPGLLLSLKEAALRSGLSHSHLRLLSRTGKINAIKMGRDWFTRLEDVVRYINNRDRRS